MRLLITGGAGFIGSALVRRALAAGHQVANLDALTYAADPEGLADLDRHRAYAFEQADVRDQAALGAILARHRPEAVLHLAAESHVDRSIDGPSRFVETNIGGTAALLHAALGYWRGLDAPARARFRLVQISTDEVFGALGPEGRFDETSPYAPNSPYAASKAAADMLVRAWRETYGLPTLLTHSSNVYGPRQFPEKLIPVVLLNALEGRPIPVYGAGEEVRDWLHVEDCAAALLAAAEKGAPGARYCIGAGAERRNLDLVRALCAALDRLAPESPHRPHAQLIRFVENRPGHDFRYAVDPSRAQSALGWRAEIPFERGLEQTVAWILANRAWWTRMRARAEAAAAAGRRIGLGRPESG